MLVWVLGKDQTTKGKRYTTEDKIRILREVDRGGKSIQAICQEQNISEVSFHRWKHQFGHMEINEARRLKELERENRELKLNPAAGVSVLPYPRFCGAILRLIDKIHP